MSTNSYTTRWDLTTSNGEFSGWYVNFEAPVVRSGARLQSVDWHLDLWISSDGIGRWKDEDEAAAAMRAGHVTGEQLSAARDAGQVILDDVELFLLKVGDWTKWIPSSEWNKLNLPV